ncbi:MAG: hypothetical protein H6839_13930 [Planctomycetes bacterium]|nr:hypothetical protein [Planctomycetota bacterium]
MNQPVAMSAPPFLPTKMVLMKGDGMFKKRRLCTGDLIMEPGRMGFVVYLDQSPVSGKQVGGSAFGLIGAAVGAAIDAARKPKDVVDATRQSQHGMPLDDRVRYHELSAIWGAGEITKFVASWFWGTYLQVGKHKFPFPELSKPGKEAIKAWCHQNGVQAK